MLLALIIFIITYVSLLVFPKYRAYIAMASAIIFIVLNILPYEKAFGYLDFNVLMMIAGTMGIVILFIESKMPALLADLIIEKTPNVKWAIVSLALFAGIISAFIDNVATVLMIAPVALNIAKKLKISPVPSIIAIAISSNLQGAATLVGDTTSIMLGSVAHMDFLDFFFMEGKIGIFWVVEAGALLTMIILLYFFRNETTFIEPTKRTEVNSYFPSVLLAGVVVLLILASFIPGRPALTNGYICMSLMVIGLIYKIVKTKKFSSIFSIVKEIDFFTILLLAGLFLVIGGITEAGVILEISEIISNIGQGSPFMVYTIIVWASVLISAFVDNIPYVATMLPVTTQIATNLGITPYVLYFGLLIGATLGGNITPIGASANITGIGILRKEGYEVKAKEFMKLGIPFTLTAVITGYILIWVIWGI
ncbi:MAG: SLC13 family permease [Bacilli bacterium]|nr:SLC13 family permease [Bacilli bacterium]